MKRILLLVLLSLAGKTLLAQSPTPICGIYYDYNAIGQRIKRSYDCKVPDGNGPSFPPGYNARLAPPDDKVEENSETSTSQIKVFPNLTPGPYTIAFSEAPKAPVHYHWYNEKGQILTSGITDEQKTIGNIAAWADGVYLLQAYTPAGTKAFRIIKITSTP